MDAIINSAAHLNNLSPFHGKGLYSESSSLLKIAELCSVVKLLADQESFLRHMLVLFRLIPLLLSLKMLQLLKQAGHH